MAALFVPLDGPMMRPERRSSGEGPEEAQGIERAERLLQSLTGIVSARMVASPGGEIQEIHILTNEEVAPKQTVRNVESALLAELGIEVDHRKISVAQTKDPRPAASAAPGASAGAAQPAGATASPDDPRVLQAMPSRVREERILFVGHQVETQRSHQVKMRVVLEWRGARFEGDAVGAELPRARLETVARATLRAVESVLRAGTDGNEKFSLALDGVRLMDAFERQYVLVSVHGITGRDVTALSGAGGVHDAPDRAVILATLQATDRWVRGRI